MFAAGAEACEVAARQTPMSGHGGLRRERHRRGSGVAGGYRVGPCDASSDDDAVGIHARCSELSLEHELERAVGLNVAAAIKLEARPAVYA